MDARRNKKAATRAEKFAASEVGARLTPLSGAGTEKGDSRISSRVGTEMREGLRVESKMTRRPAYSLNIATWMKLVKAAASAGEHPVLHVRLPGHDLAVVSWGDAKWLWPHLKHTTVRRQEAKSLQIATKDWMTTVEQCTSEPTHYLIQLGSRMLAVMRYKDFSEAWKKATA